MKIVDYFKNFIKRIFNKKQNVNFLLNKSQNIENNIESNLKNNFMNSLKQNVVKRKKNEVETMVCVGDGLGISNKIEY